MSFKLLLPGIVGIWLFSGCATAELSHAGRNIVQVASPPGPECKNLGVVIGQGGGAFGGAYVANDDLMQYAINDAQNKAAERGATHLQMSPPQLGGGGGTTTTATVTGIAYQCPNSAGAASTGSEAAATPTPSTTATSVLANCPAQEGEDLRARYIRCSAESKKK